MTDVAAAVERVWRSDSASMLGVLARRLGDLDRAEEALQDALAEALKHWADEGVPPNPPGWLVTTAWRKAVDRIRRDATGQEKAAQAAGAAGRLGPAGLGAMEPPEPTEDDRLALIFACCHPALPEPARVALTLNAASGLSAEEIAAAFLVPTPTMAQRLVRAKRRLREAGVRFEPPEPTEYPQRLAAVLQVVYLVFNEGYLASGRDQPQRRELAREGLDLARQLADLVPTEPEAAGLAALLELHEARAETRFDSWGRLVLLEDQDRHRWNRPLIHAAMRRLTAAAALDRPGPYQVQAGIAGRHALAPSFAETDWAAVRGLYDLLYGLGPSPVVLLNRAVATRYTHGPAAALAEVEALAPDLGEYRLLHAIRAELLHALGRTEQARDALGRALALATNPAERDLLSRRLSAR
jgi:RNA polymerase sigma-70 factor (ECF subfamily)